MLKLVAESSALRTMQSKNSRGMRATLDTEVKTLDAEVNMKKGAALCLVVPLLAILSSVEVMAGATISDRRYWPNEARGSPSGAVEISPPYIYPAPSLEPPQPRIRPRRKAGKNR